MNNGICYIFGAGEHYPPAPCPRPADYVIAADGGLEYLKQHNIPADMVVGDFDSLKQPPQHPNVLQLPQEKDDTDMLAAINAGLRLGLRHFHIYGGTGGRLDHTLANIQCLAHLSIQGAQGFLYGEDYIVTSIKDSSISFPSGGCGVLSVFAHSNICTGVYESGFKYELNNATLHNNYPLGISNEFTGKPCSISVESGTLIIIYPKDIMALDM